MRPVLVFIILIFSHYCSSYAIVKGEKNINSTIPYKTGTIHIRFNNKETIPNTMLTFGLFKEQYLPMYKESKMLPKESIKFDGDYEDYVGTDLVVCCFNGNLDYKFQFPIGEYYGFFYNENFGEWKGMRGPRHPAGVSDFPFANQTDQQFTAVFGYRPNILNTPDHLKNDRGDGNCFAIEEKRGNFRDGGTPIYYLDDIKIWSCPKIVIKENKEITINIESEGPKVDWNATRKQWFPGIFILAPLVSGSVVYKQDFKVQIVNSGLPAKN